MQHHWLNKKQNKNLIIFFAGWSFDYKPFEFLDCGEVDVLMFYDYSNLDFESHLDVANINENYEQIALIAWSMGVFAAYELRDKLPEFTHKIAINGTPYPVHNDWGIPLKTFDLTLKHVQTGLGGRFYKNIFKTEEEFNRYMLSPVLRTLENRADELRALDTHIKARTTIYRGFYDIAIISNTDKIIPSKNQEIFWSEQVQCHKNKSTHHLSKLTYIKTLESGHFPFYNYKSWDEILKCK